MSLPAASASPASPTSPGPAATIADRGYRRYEGPRRGPGGAVVSLYWASVQRALGLRRPFRFKLVPIATAVISFVPAVVFVGVSALIPDAFSEGITPSYAAGYGYITAAIILFVSLVGPEVLCADRRTGLLGLYLAAPLTRTTYLVGKAAAVGSVLSIVTIGPSLLLLVGYTLNDAGPGWPVDGLVVLLRILLAGGAMAVFFTLLSLAIASTTPRTGFAGAGVILSLLVSEATVNVLIGSAEMPERLRVFELIGLPFDVVTRVFGEENAFVEVDSLTVWGAFALWTLAFGAFLWLRYRRLAVTK
ncbi:MAG: hypothetical protein ACKVWR_14115 [Acidimicrobiales bacterium]